MEGDSPNNQQRESEFCPDDLSSGDSIVFYDGPDTVSLGISTSQSESRSRFSSNAEQTSDSEGTIDLVSSDEGIPMEACVSSTTASERVSDEALPVEEFLHHTPASDNQSFVTGTRYELNHEEEEPQPQRNTEKNMNMVNSTERCNSTDSSTSTVKPNYGISTSEEEVDVDLEELCKRRTFEEWMAWKPKTRKKRKLSFSNTDDNSKEQKINLSSDELGIPGPSNRKKVRGIRKQNARPVIQDSDDSD